MIITYVCLTCMDQLCIQYYQESLVLIVIIFVAYIYGSYILVVW